jgi:hypothetical protein
MFGWFFPLMVAGTSHPQTQSNPQNATRPNIILVFSDDHARQAISAYGSKLIKTPSIDRLASQGTLFTRHYTSNPICAPSRATLLTGLYSHANGHKEQLQKANQQKQAPPQGFGFFRFSLSQMAGKPLGHRPKGQGKAGQLPA